MLVFQPACYLVPKRINWEPGSLLPRTHASQKLGTRDDWTAMSWLPKMWEEVRACKSFSLRARKSSYTESQISPLNKGFNDSTIRNASFTFIYLTANSYIETKHCLHVLQLQSPLFPPSGKTGQPLHESSCSKSTPFYVRTSGS